METTLLILILCALWTLLLGAIVIIWRSLQVLQGKSQSNEFASGIKHGGDRYWRANRAHINSAENLPIIGVVICVATLVGQAGLIETLAILYLCARITQSILHISSNHIWVVNFRFTALLTQYICIGLMAWKIIPFLL